MFSFGWQGVLVSVAVFYNAILAIINGHVKTLSSIHVMGTEILIVFAALLFVAINSNRLKSITPVISFLIFTFLSFLYVSFVNDVIALKSFRDMLLIVVFFLLGSLCEKSHIINIFRALGIVTAIFMAVEIFSTDFYAYLFEPAKYFVNTRAIEVFEADSSGLFRNALGYENRFSYGFLSTHRVSSVFLEQVSLGNFAMVLSIFVICFWKDLKRVDRGFFLFLIPFIILTTSGRASSVICLVILAGAFVFPYLPKRGNIFVIPAILLLSFIFFYNPYFTAHPAVDNIQGRIGLTMHHLANIDTAYFTGGRLEDLNGIFDCGYVYVIFTQTIFGLIALWLFSALSIPPDRPENKKFLYAVAFYIGLNLLVSVGIFSIKVAAPLWLIAGYLHQRSMQEPL